jgi:hypothetical protein
MSPIVAAILALAWVLTVGITWQLARSAKEEWL